MVRLIWTVTINGSTNFSFKLSLNYFWWTLFWSYFRFYIIIILRIIIRNYIRVLLYLWSPLGLLLLLKYLWLTINILIWTTFIISYNLIPCISWYSICPIKFNLLIYWLSSIWLFSLIFNFSSWLSLWLLKLILFFSYLILFSYSLYILFIISIILFDSRSWLFYYSWTLYCMNYKIFIWNWFTTFLTIFSSRFTCFQM